MVDPKPSVRLRRLDERDLAQLRAQAAPLRRRLAELYGAPGSEPDTLEIEALQRFIADGRLEGDSDAEVMALATLFGEVAVRNLTLTWVEAEDEDGLEWALRYGRSAVVFYPRRMIRSQLAHGDCVDLVWLLAQAGEYLESLRRFVPTQTRS